MPMPTIADEIKRLRTSRGMTQAQLAEACDVSARTVQGWESGTQDPRGRDLVAIAGATRSRLTAQASGWRARSA